MCKNSGSLEIYRDSPRETRIDPTYYPYEQRHSWDAFDKIQARLPLALNYPKLPSPQHYTELKEDWMAKLCLSMVNRLADVPQFTIKMFFKFMDLIYRCLIDFEDIKLLDHIYHRFHFGNQKLAFDFYIGLVPQ